MQKKILKPTILENSIEDQAKFLKKLMGNHGELIKFIQNPQAYCKQHNVHLSPSVIGILNNKILGDERVTQHADNLGPVYDSFLSSVTSVVSSAASAVSAVATVVAAKAATAASSAASAVADAAETAAPVVVEAAEAAAPVVVEVAEAAAPVVAEAAEATAVAAIA